jgi:hypothetical protein
VRRFAMSARWNFNEGIRLRPQSAMVPGSMKGAAPFSTGERAEVYGYVRGGMVGASGAPSRKGGLVTCQVQS